MKNWTLWLRWSWRDLRSHWLQVLAIALIIALGTGIYSGLVSTSPWRYESNDASFAKLNMYDLRLSLSSGSYLEADAVRQAVRSIPHADWITAMDVRLITSTLVDASTADQTIILPGRIIGMDITANGPRINDVFVTEGRALTTSDAGQPIAILEHKLATYYGLPSSGELKISNGHTLRYIGKGLSPEYFIVSTEEGGVFAQANFAVVFMPLASVQSLTKHANQINDVLFKLTREADQQVLRSELESAIRQVAKTGISFMRPTDDYAYNTLYEDIESDEILWRWLAYLFLAGAVFGAFNLATRLVEAQRREIGIQMALGVLPRWIAIRPLLVAVQIALLGVVLGVVIGWIGGQAFATVLVEMMPLPVFLTSFQPQIYVEGALLGICLPLIATLLPIIRAIRVEPVEAITTGHLVAKGGGFAPLVSKHMLKGSVLQQMPFRNLLRAPRRALLTLLGMAAAMALLGAIMCLLDSFISTLDAARTEIYQNSPQRMTVNLNLFIPAQSPMITEIRAMPLVSEAEPSLRLGGYLMNNGKTIETILDLIPIDSTLWRPSLSAGAYPTNTAGVIISSGAAETLGVRIGDMITLRHPKRTGLFSYDWIESPVQISGTHPLPFQFQTYMNIDQAALMGMANLANVIQLEPAPGVAQDELKRAMFEQFDIASVQPVSALISMFEDLIKLFIDFFLIVEVAGVILAILITYNSTSISLDERVRETATMFAFGVPVHKVVSVAIVENLVMSVIGVVIGCIIGYWLVVNLVHGEFSDVLTGINLAVTLKPTSILVALAIAIAVAVLTPLLSLTKMLNMNIPSTLRVME